MTPIELFERQLPDGLADLADARVPGYLDDILAESRRTRQRPRWTFFERWLPMTLISVRSSTAPPPRAAWMLLLVGLLTAALITSLVIVGSVLLRNDGADGQNAGLMVPTLELDSTWDTTTIAGLDAPSGMDLGPDGNLYVVNAGASEILVLGLDGTVIRRWGGRGSDNGQFEFHTQTDHPEYTIGGVGVSPDGSVYVVDSGNDRLQQFDANGRFIRGWGGFGGGDGRFLVPFDVEVGPDGRVYVVDMQRNDIQRFAADGTFERTIGSPGSGPGQLFDTGSIQLGSDETIYSADYGNNRVQALDRDGDPLWSMGAGVGLTTFDGPGDLALGRDGNLFVSDKAGIRAFDDQHAQIASWSLPLPDPDDDWIPFVIAPDGWAYVASSGLDRIYRLRVGAAEASTPAPSSGPLTPAPPDDVEGVVPSLAAPAGTTKVRIAETFAVPLTFELPPGWEKGDVSRGYASAQKPGEPGTYDAFVNATVPIAIHPDPCHPDTERTVDTAHATVEDLTDALTHLVGFRAGAVTDITIDGYAGKTFDLEEMVGIDLASCSSQTWLQQMTYDGAVDGDVQLTDLGVGAGGGWHQRFAIVDVDGTPVVLQTWTFRGTSRAVVEEALHVLESVDFD